MNKSRRFAFPVWPAKRMVRAMSFIDCGKWGAFSLEYGVMVLDDSDSQARDKLVQIVRGLAEIEYYSHLGDLDWLYRRKPPAWAYARWYFYTACDWVRGAAEFLRIIRK